MQTRSRRPKKTKKATTVSERQTRLRKRRSSFDRLGSSAMNPVWTTLNRLQSRSLQLPPFVRPITMYPMTTSAMKNITGSSNPASRKESHSHFSSVPESSLLKPNKRIGRSTRSSSKLFYKNFTFSNDVNNATTLFQPAIRLSVTLKREETRTSR